MKSKKVYAYIGCFFYLIPSLSVNSSQCFYKNGEAEFIVTGTIKNESEFDIFTTLLRDNIHDKLFYTRTTADLMFFGDTPSVQAKLAVRSRLVWGNHKITTTDRKYLVTLDALPTVHAHTMGPSMFWVREAWFEADLAKLCHTDLAKQLITVGSFSFKLGRGISLGDAYRVNPLSIDFYQDSVVDQYTWGVKWSGASESRFLNYDIYVTILNNQSTDLEETNLPTRINTFGTNNLSKVRGAGVINYIAAAHCMFTPLKTDEKLLTIDPYVMHFVDPEQKVEYLFDAKTSLTTTGFAVECVMGNLEWGFDCANNFGYQYVRGWDRNYIENVDKGGYSAYVYTDILTVNPLIQEVTESDLAFFDPSNTDYAQAIASVTPGSVSNGKPIAGTPFYNSLIRYRDPYTTTFRGYMWVGDATVWVIPKTCALSVTAGIASGDANPNANLLDPFASSVDSTYNGFIPIQEMYAGNRVQSYFYMASGLVPLLSSANIDSYFSYGIDTLSNVVFWGSSLKYQQKTGNNQWSVMPNIIMYWQDFRTKVFDVSVAATTDRISSAYKGVEANLFIQSQLTKEVALGAGFAMFVPGTFFFENKGEPFSAATTKELIKALKAGASLDQLPLLGDNTICSGTVALTYTF